nr:hypothetical protein [Tanacetum cinerariifolium]
PGRTGRYCDGALGGTAADGILRRFNGCDLPSVLDHDRLGHGPFGTGRPDLHPGAVRHDAQTDRPRKTRSATSWFLWLVQPYLRPQRAKLRARRRQHD